MRYTGTLKNWNHAKQFGFIAIEDGSAPSDIFVHVSDLPPGIVLSQGARLSFETTHTHKGPRAVNVQLA